MRLGSYVLMGVSALALAACNTTGSTSQHSASAPVTAGTTNTEAQEMAAVMGGAPDMIDVTAVDVQETQVAHTPGVPEGCPIVEVLPDTRSITYFEGDAPAPNAMTARAAIKEIRGGCEYQDNAVVVDIDMIMEGTITDKARYEGRKDLEAFMTFPYFIAVMDPDGNMVDKKIMATAMRFKPNDNNLDHAEKITQTITLSDIGLGSHYTIATGFQLTRAQLDYNRGSVSESKPAAVKKAVPKAAPKKAEAPKEEPAKVEAEKVEVEVEKVEVETTQAGTTTVEASVQDTVVSADVSAEEKPTPAAAKSGTSKMSPIVE